MNKLILVALTTGIITSLAFADNYVPGVETYIKSIDSYNHGAAAGDIRILVGNPVANCADGYFLSLNDIGIDRTLSIALSAFHSGAKVVIGGRDGIPWDGSSSTDYCKVHAIQILK